MVMVLWVYAFLQIRQVVYIKYIQNFVCQLYLKSDFFNVLCYINMSNIFIYILSLKKKEKRIKAVGPDGGG